MLPCNLPLRRFRNAAVAFLRHGHPTGTEAIGTTSQLALQMLWSYCVSLPIAMASEFQLQNYPITKSSVRKPELLRRRPFFHTDTAFRPGGPRIPCGTFSQTRWSASPPHRPADRTFVPACSPPDTACCRCLSSSRHRRRTEAKSSSASPCLRGRECTIHNFRV